MYSQDDLLYLLLLIQYIIVIFIYSYFYVIIISIYFNFFQKNKNYKDTYPLDKRILKRVKISNECKFYHP